MNSTTKFPIKYCLLETLDVTTANLSSKTDGRAEAVGQKFYNNEYKSNQNKIVTRRVEKQLFVPQQNLVFTFDFCSFHASNKFSKSNILPVVGPNYALNFVL